ncbi:MAG: alpha-galactosidase [Clostridia bacterium]|nr:alpha-galactosidase [Clostridia bacterium]
MNFTTETKNQIEKQEIIQTKKGEVSEYLVKIVFKEKCSPEKFTIKWQEPQIDMMGFWGPMNGTDNNITPEWWPRQVNSRTASGLPLFTLYSKSNENKVTVALSDPSTPCTLSTGAVEENGCVSVKIDLFSQLTSAIKEYEVTIRIDRRKIPFYDAIKDAREWWDTLGYKCAYVPDSAKLPMYSTWYSFHQKTIPEEILYECKIAKEYGMDTVIVDDGWQTDDNSRGYAFCGDWQVCEKKIPDMKKFVDDVHAIGMKFMIWFSVPFVGSESKNYERFKGKYLRFKGNTGEAVLDPRFKEVRDFLTDVYVSSVEKYGWDGLKLDFIDSFSLTENSPTDFENMDTVSVEEGVQLLLNQTMEKLRKINPEILIEFRQSYIGPAISKYGNMFRVGDCPTDPIYNRINSLKLRLTSKDTAVHSDMIMWNENDTNEGVLYQLLAVMFAVPQISIRFDNITSDHKRLLKNYLSFWRNHRETLLNGELTLLDAEANYSLAQSKNDKESVAVLYQGVVKKAENLENEYIFNSTGYDGIYVDASKERNYEIYDIFGNKYQEGKIPGGVSKLPVKNCEMVRLF